MHNTPPQSLSLHIDFDSTLFNTKMFVGDLLGDITARTGLTEQHLRQRAEHFFGDPVLRDFDYEGFIRDCGLEPELMWQHLDSLMQANNYLFDDSADFIQQLQRAGYRPAILSFGEQRFQRAKIIPNLHRLSSGAPPDFEVIYRPKGEYIAKTYKGKRGALVDDVPGQNLPDGFTEIHLHRALGLTKPEPKPGGFTVSSLEQARQVICRL